MSERRSFSFEDFYHRNRRILIWGIFFTLLWVLRDFFGLILLTYVLALLAARLVRLCQDYLRLARRPAIIGVYLLFLGAASIFAFVVVPRVVAEANTMTRNLGDIQNSVLNVKAELFHDHPVANSVLMLYIDAVIDDERSQFVGPRRPPEGEMAVALTVQAEEELAVRAFLSQQAEEVRAWAPRLLGYLSSGTATAGLALLFSFLIMMDFAHLAKDIQSLRLSRLHDFYEQTAQPVVRFAWVVGRAIEAQAMIAGVNTLLTFIGLLFLRIPSLAMLSLIVFLCSFIPVLGVFISTVPIVLMALNQGGINTAIAAIVMIIIIHAIEAYLLNPLIYGHKMKLNPVVVLIILLVGHHLFGLWGMLLGVPVAYYFIHDVFGVPVWTDRHERAGATAGIADAQERPVR